MNGIKPQKNGCTAIAWILHFHSVTFALSITTINTWVEVDLRRSLSVLTGRNSVQINDLLISRTHKTEVECSLANSIPLKINAFNNRCVPHMFIHHLASYFTCNSFVPMHGPTLWSCVVRKLRALPWFVQGNKWRYVNFWYVENSVQNFFSFIWQPTYKSKVFFGALK